MKSKLIPDCVQALWMTIAHRPDHTIEPCVTKHFLRDVISIEQ